MCVCEREGTWQVLFSKAIDLCKSGCSYRSLLSVSHIGFISYWFIPRREARGFLMYPECLESQGCQFDPTSLYLHVLLPSPVALSLILFCFWPILLISFPHNRHSLKGRLFCVALVFCLFERLGDEYFSWWYVQHMLPYGTFYGLYIGSIFNLRLLLSIPFYNFFNLILKCQTEMVSGTSIS